MGRLKTILQILAIAVLVTGSVVPFFFNTGSAMAQDEPCDDCQQGQTEGEFQYPAMRPSPETLRKWVEDYNNAPIAPVYELEGFRAPSPQQSLSLLDHLQYTPSERDQGYCGNCWVWAGTGVMEIALDVQEGVKDRLSIQYLNSNYADPDWACCGGWLEDLADFYTGAEQAIPWANTNASWQDGGQDCYDSTTVDAGTISTTPNYPITSITEQTITTQGVGETTAIDNIKNILDQNKAVWFGFFVATSADWNNFTNFWGTQPESAIWDPDFSCGHETVDGPLGHAVLCVGYNDEEGTENDYWIMLNSWGTTAGRPNGLFRLDMHMDYDCYFYYPAPYGYYSFYFQTLAISYSIPTLPEVWVDDDFDDSTPGWGYDHFATIQEGIDAVSGSTVHVAAGYYTENITLVDGVEVLGEGADVTTIDGGASGPVVTADTITSTTTFDGFTVQNGSGYENGSYTYGGGMYIVNTSSSLTVSNCTFTSSSATYGGGVYNEDSSPTVTSCTFEGNSAMFFGGGMYNDASSPTLANCTFTGNSASRGGGVLNIYHASPTVTDCTFTGNSASAYGGGIGNDYSSSPTVTECTFTSNTATYFGGGVWNNDYSSGLITDCTFTSNSAAKGGGIYNSRSLLTVTNCTFTGNSATDYGGGMNNTNSSMGEDSPVVTNCTFTGNSASQGGGMYNHWYCSPTVTNCTFSGNSATEGDGIYNDDSSPTVTNCILWDGGDEIYDEGTSAPVVTYCDVQGGYGDPEDNNINSDPLFDDPGTDDYHLQLGSPCIDVGDNSAPSIPSTDFEGDPRIMDGDGDLVEVVDIGVDECYGPSVFGLLRVETSPAVPTTISIDGIPRSAWGLNWVKMSPGEYTLSFTDTFGYLAPSEIEVTYEGEDAITQPVTDPITVYTDETTEVMVHCIQLGNLWVRTDPMVATIISLDGVPPSNNWGFWVDLLPGDYNLSLSDVIVYKTPIEVEVTYPGEAPVIQAITDPITVEPGGTTAVVIHFIRLGNLKVETSPNLAATIFVDGKPMNDWGFWVDLEEGDYTVSFEDMDGYLTPPPTVVTITAEVTTYVTGDYDNGQTIVTP